MIVSDGLKLLNKHAQTIALDNTPEGLFEDVLLLVAIFVQASFAIVFPSAKNWGRQ